MANELSSDLKELNHQCSIIDGSLDIVRKEWVFVGHAFAKIRDDKLYAAAGYKSFEKFVAERYGMTPRDVYRKIAASQAAEHMLTVSKDKSIVYSHANQIAVIAETPAAQKKIWTRTLSKNEKPTAKLIKQVAKELAEEAAESRQDRERSSPSNSGSNVIFVNAETKTKPKSDADEPEKAAEPENQDDDAKYTGKPSGGATFNTKEFETAHGSDGEEDPSAPNHLKHIQEKAKEFRAIRLELIALEKRCMELAAHAAGSWMRPQEISRIFEMLKLEIKTTAYECCCPSCKTKPDKRCIKCEGRGFLDHTNYGYLTEAEKLWTQDQAKKSQ